MCGVTLSCMCRPAALPVIFLNPSTNNQAREPVLPNFIECIFLPFLVIGRGVNIRLGPVNVKFRHVVHNLTMTEYSVLTCSKIPCQSDVAFNETQSQVIRVDIMLTFLTHEDHESYLFHGLRNELKSELESMLNRVTRQLVSHERRVPSNC